MLDVKKEQEEESLRSELTEEISRMNKDDLWKLHKAVTEIKYATNMAKYRKLGLLLTTPPASAEVVSNG